MFTMFDSVTLGTVPSDAPALAGYTSGFWPTYGPMVAQFPKLAKAGRILSIAVNVNHDAECLDCEPRDATPDQVPAWVERQLARGVERPVVYSSVSEYPQILVQLNAHGINRSEIRIWTAHYNGHEHICSAACNPYGFVGPADATQWTDKALGGRNLDQSICEDEFFNAKPRPSAHYGWYPTEIKVNKQTFNERAIVQAYDRLRDHPLSQIIPNRPKLRELRNELRILADRVARVAIDDAPDKDGKPSWGVDHRGWRYQTLIHRSQGKRVA